MSKKTEIPEIWDESEKNKQKLEVMNQDKLQRMTKAKRLMTKFYEAKNFQSSRLDTYTELNSFYQGTQSLLSKYKVERPWVVQMNTGHAAANIDLRVASLITNDYKGELQPISADDVEHVRNLQDVLMDEWDKLYLDDAIDTVIEDGAVTREEYVHLYFEPKKVSGGTNNLKKGKLCKEFIEPGAIHIDPKARCLKNADYCVLTKRITKKQAYAKYKDVLPSEDELKEDLNPQDRGEIYVENDYHTGQQDSVFTQLTFFERDYEQKKIKKSIVIAGFVVFEQEIPFFMFPIVQFRWKKAKNSPYGLSLMDELINLQKAVNAIESATANTAIAYANPALGVRKGCGLNPKAVANTAGAPGVVYHIDGPIENAIRPIIPPAVDDKMIQIKNDYINTMERLSGVTNQYLGNIGTAGNTSGGTQKAIERATIIEAKIHKNIKEFVVDLVELLVEYIKFMYSKEEVTLSGKKNQYGEFTFPKVKLGDLENIEYKFFIDMNKKTPFSKERQKEKLLELYQLQNQYKSTTKLVTELDIINAYDLSNVEEMRERFKQMTSVSNEDKASMIQLLINASTGLNIPPEALNAAITEIMNDPTDTPILDDLLQQIQQLKEQQLQEQQMQEQQMMEQQMAEQQMMGQQGAQMPMGEPGMEAMTGGQISPEAMAMAEQMMQQ